MKRIALLILVSIVANSSISAQNCAETKQLSNQLKRENQQLFKSSFADSIDILNYTINLNITDFTNKIIKGNTEVKVKSKFNGINKMRLDLLKMIVDSVEIGGANLSFQYNDTLLKINLPLVLNANDSTLIKVYYHGKPQIDGTGWGGFYFESGYAYNLGVGFGANPHVYGRVWFPCIDNFTDRATYEFNIETNNGKVAICNGYLVSDVLDGQGNRMRKWKMDQPIPTYLACVAIGNYTPVIYNFQGKNKTYPVQLSAVAADTVNVKKSFANLNLALSTFENSFGPYEWNKVGYSFVPFNSGAMEHATNITFPRSFADGTLGFQSIMAHELSHHWFGDLITCSTAEDMWINEGWASYCESIFTEQFSGYANYLAEIRSLHESNLQFNIPKEGALSLNNIPHEFTYGDHVYKRGAEVAHSLRGYMGDSLFFASVKSFLSKNKYQAVSSVDLMGGLSQESGKNLSYFFEAFVFNPGWAQFSIDSFQSVFLNGKYQVRVYVKQRLNHAPSYFLNVPLTLTFKNSNFLEYTSSIMASGANDFFEVTVPFKPQMVGINMDEKIALATAPEYRMIKNTGSYTLSNAKFTLQVNQMTDSAFVSVEHHYASPDAIKASNSIYTISPNHYWKVDGILPTNFQAKGTVPYNGRTNTFSGNDWLDNELINTTEDKVFLLYRKSAKEDWYLFPYQTRNVQGNGNDRRGIISIDSLWLGEYAMAVQKPNTGLFNNHLNEKSFELYPNPSADFVNIDLKNSGFLMTDKLTVKIKDLNGRIIKSEKLKSKQGLNVLSTIGLTAGAYLISIESNSVIVADKKMIKQ